MFNHVCKAQALYTVTQAVLAYQRQGALGITGLQGTCQRLNDRFFVLEKTRKKEKKKMTSSNFLMCRPKIRSLLFLLQALLPLSVFACKGKLYFLAKKKGYLHQFFACQCKGKLYFLEKKNTVPSSICHLSMQRQAVFS